MKKLVSRSTCPDYPVCMHAAADCYVSLDDAKETLEQLQATIAAIEQEARPLVEWSNGLDAVIDRTPDAEYEMRASREHIVLYECRDGGRYRLGVYDTIAAAKAACEEHARERRK